MSGVREEGAAGVFDCALFGDNVRRAAARAGDQREKRIGAKSVLQSWRRLQLLLRQFDALQKERWREPIRRERLSFAPAMDDLALKLAAARCVAFSKTPIAQLRHARKPVSGGIVRLVLAAWLDNMELIPSR
jgi:hypothetical protein